MSSQRRKSTIFSLVNVLLSIAVLGFLLTKSQAALSKVKVQYQAVKPVWDAGTETTATAAAEGETTKTRIFFKAQDVRLEYYVNGISYSCLNRMSKKDFDKIDGTDRDGRGDVTVRYDPSDPSHAATKQSVDMWKKEKNSYNAVKWICIIYLVSDAIALLFFIYSMITLSREEKEDRRRLEAVRAQKRLDEALERKRKEERERKRQEEERERKRQEEERERKRQEEERERRRQEEESERQRQQEEAARREEISRQAPPSASGNEKTSEKPQPSGQEDNRGSIMNAALQEAQSRSGKNTGLTDDWKKVLEEAAEQAIRQRSGTESAPTGSDADVPALGDDATVYDADVSSLGDDATVYDADVSSLGDDATVYDADVPAFGDDATVYDADVSSLGDDSAVYDADVAPGSYPRGYELNGTYRIDSDPIKGGMGRVWKVHHMQWDVDLAMKRPKEGFFTTDQQKEDFIRECRSWINLGIHPNIVACYYVREIQGVPAIFSEWMENGTLAQRIADKSLYDASAVEIRERLLDIAIQFAEGLHYAHRSQLIHRDVKPANLLLSKDWEARVADFGIAQVGKTRANENVMTSAYCSPEQAARKKLSRKTDIYSWAVSVLEMYMGERPWQSGTMVGLVCREYFGMAKIPMADSLCELLEKCLQNETKNRPRDFASVIKELKAIYKEVTGRAYPRPAARVSQESADNLNNQALSYLDLNRSPEAQDLWTRAALMEPAHTKTLFNRCLFGYRSGRMTLYEAQCFLSANWENHFNQAEPGLLLAELSLEGGDLSTVKDVLSYVRNYSTQQEELSEQAEEKLASLEKMADGGSWHCSYQLSRVKNYKEQETLQIERDKRLRELKNLAKKGLWEDANRELMISHLGQTLGDALYQKDWLEFYEELSRKCAPLFVLGQWPIMTVPQVRRYDRVSFSDDSRFFFCGERLYDLETGELVRDNAAPFEMFMTTRASGLSPDGSFYLQANVNGNGFLKMDARTGEPLAVCAGHEKRVTALAISRDGRCFASGDEGGTLKIWNGDGSLIKSTKITPEGDEPLEDIQFGYDARKLVLRYRNRVILLDQAEGTTRALPYDNYLEVAVNLGYTGLGMAAGRSGLHYMDLTTNQARPLNDEDAVRRRGRGISTASQVCFMHNQRFLLASDGDMLFFFNPEMGKILSAIHMGGDFKSIAISRNGKYVAAISGGKAQLWQCIYGLQYMGADYADDIIGPCAHVQRRAHPEKSPEELIKPLLEELADRGYGEVPAKKAFEALRAVPG